MLLITLLMFTISLIQLGSADYNIDVISLNGLSENPVVIQDDDGSGQITINLLESVEGFTYRATFFEKVKFAMPSINGDVCGEIDESTAEGLLMKILSEIIDTDDCPVPAGSYPVKKSFSVKGDAFKDVLPPGFEVGGIRVVLSHPEKEGTSQQAVYISVKVTEVK
ncbi:uncharacterized protein LOC135169169 [Diachasmimorpha longicaudata]|uniref:uncharacterized protein LOC135169169 n=1 Tax=Diachasmimorpha longicaudata TaxID=58733 RepID=UPI0030B8FECA